MGKILIFVSILVSLLTAGVGFLNKGKLSEAADKATAAEASANSAKAELTKAQATLKTTSENLASLTTEKEALAAQAASAKADLDKATAQVTELTTGKTALDTQITDLTAKAAQLQTELDAAKANPVAPVAETNNEDKAKLAEQETLITKLTSDLDSSRAQLETYVKEKQMRAQGLMKPGLEGRILAVNPAWNFVVLNLGDKNGVLNNAEMLVKRGTQLIGKVRITSVEPSTSIADIVANSVPEGTSISPGDNVIFQAVEE